MIPLKLLPQSATSGTAFPLACLNHCTYLSVMLWNCYARSHLNKAPCCLMSLLGHREERGHEQRAIT